MKNTKREVWEAAQSAGLSDFIKMVSETFGRESIADVAIDTKRGTFSTSDKMGRAPKTVVAYPPISAGISKDEIKKLTKRGK